MASRQLLRGVAALAGVAAAAVCFAIVDVTVAAQCPGGCGPAAAPAMAVGFAAGGAGALLVGAVLAVSWIVEAVAQSRRHSPEDDAAAAREARPRRPAAPDEDD